MAEDYERVTIPKWAVVYVIASAFMWHAAVLALAVVTVVALVNS